MTESSQNVFPKVIDEPIKLGASRFIPKLLGWIGAALTFFVGIIILNEWFRIGVIADPKEIGGYYFGSEAMMSHGGWKYQSASIYAWTCFFEGILYIGATGLFAHSSIRNKYRRIYFAYAFLILFLAYDWYNKFF